MKMPTNFHANLVAVAFMASLASGAANAISIDFGQIAEDVKNKLGTIGGTHNEAHWNDGDLDNLIGFDLPNATGEFVKDAGIFYYQQDGIRVLATATGTAANTDAYLDGFSGGPAGIGACVDNVNDCGGNDNVAASAGEVVTLSFFDLSNNALTVTLLNSYHTNANHGTSFGGGNDLSVSGNVFDLDAGTAGNYLGSGSMMELALNLTGSSFTFTPLTGKELYISGVEVSPVPLPAAVWLFGSALLGVFGVARRKRANQAG